MPGLKPYITPDVTQSIGQVVRIINFLVLAVLAVVMPFLHYDHVKARYVCTAYDTPTNCWKSDGSTGIYRAIDFTGRTTSVVMQNAASGIVVDPFAIGNTLTPQAFAMTYAKNTINRTEAYCGIAYDEIEEPDKYLACEAVNIPVLWEAPNELYFRKLYTVSGGVDVWFMVWLSTFLAASFALVMFPSAWGTVTTGSTSVDTIKLYTLITWHVICILFMVSIYADDANTFFRVPINNISMGLGLTIFTILIQAYWLRVAMDLPTVYTCQKLATPYTQLQSSNLAGLMYLKSGPASEADNQEFTPKKPVQVELDAEVFTDKCLRHELMESLYVEFAVTVPVLVIAVFCICMPTSMDWVVQSLYLRAFIATIIPAMVIKLIAVYHHHKNPSETNPNVMVSSSFKDIKLNIILSLVSFTMFLLALFFIMDITIPVHETLFTTEFDNDFNFYARKKALFGFAVSIFAIIVFICPLYVVFVYTSEQKAHSQSLESLSHDYLQWFLWNGGQLLMLILRLLLIASVISPEMWYGYYDEKDVVLNYGAKIMPVAAT